MLPSSSRSFPSSRCCLRAHFYFYRPLAPRRPWITISLGLQLGGTLGNSSTD